MNRSQTERDARFLSATWVLGRVLKLALVASLVVSTTLLASGPANAVRLKELAYLDGVRPNQLIGYGLVVGLDGTGDTQRVGFTRQSLTAMLSRAGVRFEAKDLILRNVAAVMVTAKLPAFARPGGRLDVTVSSIGNARSIAGGTLLMTPLSGPDAKPYAVAQGALQVGGFSLHGRSGTSRLRKNHLNSGRVPNGGIVEKNVPVVIGKDSKLLLRLRRPDFTNVATVTKTLNARAAALGGKANWAKALDAGSIELDVAGKKPEELPGVIAGIEATDVAVDAPAKVVINGRTGTIVMGGNVQISAVAVAHHGLSLEVSNVRRLLQPATPATGPAPPDRRTPLQRGQLQPIPAATTLAQLVRGLNALGVEPRDLVQILQSIAAAGALQAQLEVL